MNKSSISKIILVFTILGSYQFLNAENTFFVRSPWFENHIEQYLSKAGWNRIEKNTDDCVDKEICSAKGPICCDKDFTKYCVERSKFPPTLFFTDGKWARSENLSQNTGGAKIVKGFKRDAISELVDKEKLFKTLKKNPNFEPYMLAQEPFSLKNLDTLKPLMKKYPHLILKPTGSFGGHGIGVVASRDGLEVVIAHVKKFPNYQRWVAQEYMADPLLFDNHKFHLRMYGLLLRNNAASVKDKVRIYMYPEGWIYAAPNEYGTPEEALRNMGDTGRHITNISAGGSATPFLEGFGNGHTLNSDQDIKKVRDHILQELKVLLWESVKPLKNQLVCRTKSADACFDILGMDVMVDRKTLQLKLLEHNAGVGFNLTGYADNLKREWRKEFITNILERVFEWTYGDKFKPDLIIPNKFELLGEDK